MGLHHNAPAMRFPSWEEMHGKRPEPKPDYDSTWRARVILAADQAEKTLDTVWSRLASVDGRERAQGGPLIGYFQAYGSLTVALLLLTNMADQFTDIDKARKVDGIKWELRGIQLRIEELAPINEIRRAIDDTLRYIENARYQAGRAEA